MSLDKAHVDQIRKEYREYRQDEKVLHNKDLHVRILKTWKQVSPMFHRELRVANLLHELAFVAQERMWREEDRLLQAGLPWVDAMEQAERRHLHAGPGRAATERGRAGEGAGTERPAGERPAGEQPAGELRDPASVSPANHTTGDYHNADPASAFRGVRASG